jgi:hypothetical protein
MRHLRADNCRVSSTICAFCERLSHMTMVWGQVFSGGSRVRFAATCDNCGNLSTALGPGQLASEVTDIGYAKRAVHGFEQHLEWWPKVGYAPTIEDVPPHIATAAREAYSSTTIGNNMAAILMARSVVEACAKSHGISSGNLASKIDAMRERQLIRPAIAEQAHEIRFMGNDMAHGDLDPAPEPLDAEEILALMTEVLSEVFQGPARLERIRSKRQVRATG